MTSSTICDRLAMNRSISERIEIGFGESLTIERS